MISTITDNRPYTKNDSNYITDLTNHDQQLVLDWIRENLRPIKTPLLSRSSYGIKHLMTAETGIYVTNNQFKHAMLLCGYEPVDSHSLNWNYRISKRSPAFKKEIRRVPYRNERVADVSGT
jgi:hypothetical protein